MTLYDLLITTGILIGFVLIIYLKMTKKTIKDLMLEIRDIIKLMREKND
jgi:hypothetical protein